MLRSLYVIWEQVFTCMIRQAMFESHAAAGSPT